MFKIRINPLWIVLIFILSYFGNMKIIVSYFILLLLHEMGHMYMARMLGYKFNTIDFMPYGLGLKTNTTYINVKNDILISISGPLVNFMIAIIIVVMWWVMPISYYYTLDMFYINVSIIVLNVLPIFPLDGGRVIMVLLKDKFKDFAIVIMKVATIIFIIIFMLLFILSIFTTFNITYFLFGTFLFMSFESVEFDVMLHLLKSTFDKDYSKPIEIKTFIVKGKVEYSTLIKYLSNKYVSKFICIDGDTKHIILEQDLMSKYM